MENIENKIKLLDNLPINKLDERINLLKRLTDDILNEKKKYQNLLENIDSIPNEKVFDNYKLDELQDLFQKSSLEDKIQIYKSFSTKIDKETSKIFSKYEGSDSEYDESSD